MKQSLSEESIKEIIAPLRSANLAFMQGYPGETGRRRPVHTVYGGAHLFKSDTTNRLGALARRSLEQYAPDLFIFAKAIGLAGANELPASALATSDLAAQLESNSEAVRKVDRSAWLAHMIYQRVKEKLQREPVEDFRIDYEDGYGNRPDAEEDGHAVAGAAEVSVGMEHNTLPP